MRKFFSINAIKETIKFRDRKNSNTDQQSIERASIGGKRFSNLSTNSLSSRQSYLNIEVIREGYNVDLTRVDNTFTKLHRACLLNYDEKKLLKYIKKQPISINQIDNVAHCSPMHLCVANNNLHYLSILVDNGGDVNLCDGQGKTLLIKAIECTNEQIIQYLIACRAEVNKADSKYKNTPLHWACLTAYFKAISILLNCTHINVNQANANEETILHVIAKSNKNLYVFINDCLENNGINLDKQDIKGRTPLFIACLNGNYRCVESLLNNNANPNINNLIGESPLQIAKSKGYVDIADLFEHHTTNQYLRAIKSTDQRNKPVHQATVSSTIKRNSVFSFVSDVDFVKSNNEDSWPETVSNASSISMKQTAIKNHLPTEDVDLNSFNSFKANNQINASSSLVSNDLNNKSPEVKNSKPANETSQKNDTNKKVILHPENDEFIKQMKYLIDEEIQMNEELDEMLFINQPTANSKKDQTASDQMRKPQMASIYLSESDEDWADENDTLIKKPDVRFIDHNVNQPTQSQDESNSTKKQNMIYGLSDGEDEQKVYNIQNRGDKEISSDESSQIHKQMPTQLSNNSVQQVHQQSNENKLSQPFRSIDSASSLSSEQSLKEEELVNKFDRLMMKIDEFEQRNQALSAELEDALRREKELKHLNSALNHQFEEQNQQLTILESRLKKSEENYELIRAESEQFKEDFKLEREKFERDFVKFMQEEHKQTEQHLMKLLDDKQELCNRLTDELNYLKDRYVNREQIPFANDDLINKLNANQLFGDLMRQNDKLNENFKRLQVFLDEHLVLTESVKKLNQILANLDDQFKQQSNHLNKQLSDQKNEFSEFIETNVVQYIKDLFKVEVDMKLIQVKTVVDELKQELVDFIHNYKLPKHNEHEITSLINQILIKSVKQSDILNNQQSKSNEELRNNQVDTFVRKDDSIKNDEQSDSTTKDDEKTSLQFNADDLFADERRMSDREIEIRKIRKDKIKLNRLLWNDHLNSENRLFNQYSDAILNTINNHEFVNQEKMQKKVDNRTDLKSASKVTKRNMRQDQSNFQNSHQSKLTPRIKSESKFRNIDMISSNSLFNKVDSTNFHKQRQIVEQEIANLKLQLGLLPVNQYRTSSSAWNL